MVVATMPRDGNPYQTLLEDSLRARGVVFRHPASLRESDLDGVDVVHLHWLEFLYSSEGTGAVAEARRHLRSLALRRRLRRLHRAGRPLVWTMHNLRPHESRSPGLDRRVFQDAASKATTIVAHSDHARAQIISTYDIPPDRVQTIPHGNYEGVYPEPSASRADLRAQAGLAPADQVLLSFGLIRAYKRVPGLIRDFRAADPDHGHLIVAGRAGDPAIERHLRDAAGDDPRVRLELGFADDQRVSDLHALADAAVLNYGDVFSSGVLLLSWSLGLPVIAPADTTADELADPPAAIALGPDGLPGAMAELARSEPGHASTAAKAAAATYAWDAIGHRLQALYERAMDRPAR